MKDLKGKVAVVTGGGSGIGRALGLALAQEGMALVVADIQADAAESVADEIARTGARSLGVPVDVSKQEAMNALADRAWAEFGAVHLLCNNAGVIRFGAAHEAPDEDWRWVLGVNLFGAIHGVRAFVPRMLARGGEAHVVNTASVNGLFSGYPPGVGVYATSKYAVVAFSEALRTELEPAGIGVSVLCPGDTNTAILDAGRNRPPEYGGRAEAYQRSEPVERAMSPDEVARKAIRGIKQNELYVISHADTRQPVEERFRRIMAAFDQA